MLFYALFSIPLSCYVGVSDMESDSKTAYFVVYFIVTAIVLLTKFIGG